MDPTILETMMIQLPNLAGLSILSYVLWLDARANRDMLEKELEQCRKMQEKLIEWLTSMRKD